MSKERLDPCFKNPLYWVGVMLPVPFFTMLTMELNRIGFKPMLLLPFVTLACCYLYGYYFTKWMKAKK